MAEIRHLTLVEYEHQDRRARCERDRHGWVTTCYEQGIPQLHTEHDTASKARLCARQWVEYRRAAKRGKG